MYFIYMIIDYLEANGWKVLANDDLAIFAERILTGKKSVFISNRTKISDTEVMRIWTKKGFHPFVYKIEKGGIIFYDFLFGEFVKSP